ncbi:MAG: Fic family protein [Propionibacteriaceae bacterium]|jgi:Fic family protein|nr:Fic family protein [Propionibacteriaceae bacterium]
MLFVQPELGEAELRVLQDIAELRVSMRTALYEPRRWTGSLRRLSFARNVQGSNSIEGINASLDDAAAVVDGEAPADVVDAVRRALEGYRNAMTYVLQLCNDSGQFAYNVQLIKSIHFMMTSYDMKNRPGLWRSGGIYVRNDELNTVVYEGPDVDEVPQLVDELVDTLNSPTEHSIIDAAMAHLNLVMIHPFRDGNGRMARCLQSLVLGRDGVLSPVFMSVEEYLGRNTAAYYEVLEKVGTGRWNPSRDTRPWIRFMLTAHLRQARTQRQRMRDYERLWLQLVALLGGDDESRFLPALFDAALGMRITRGNYLAQLAANGDEISEQSAGRDLRQLVDKGLLVPEGENRGRSYLAADPVSSRWKEIRSGRPTRDDSDPFSSAS